MVQEEEVDEADEDPLQEMTAEKLLGKTKRKLRKLKSSLKSQKKSSSDV